MPDPALRASNLSKAFGGLIAVDRVDLDLFTTEVHAVIGPNGAGKTTLFGVISGFLAPSRGDVSYDGESIIGISPDRLVRRGLMRSFQIVQSFAVIQEIVERGQADGSIRADLDARLASYVFYGAVEELLTGWVLGRLPDSEEDVARAERTLVEIVTGGLAPELATAGA
jgi:ABC-type uncharacterized transport system ATPase subunit